MEIIITHGSTLAGIAESSLPKMSRWVNSLWRATGGSPDDKLMNPGEMRKLLAKSPAASPKTKSILLINANQTLNFEL
ncbi:MAG: hypothetical protein L3J11_05595 [Draconibacterium sp.]|nr:hypothetical protein [Draconibacterium sp.]